MKLRKVLFLILTAACWFLQAAFILWFWPMLLQDWASGEWERRDRKLKKWWKQNERRLFEDWLRKENETRRKRVWKNSKNFYK